MTNTGSATHIGEEITAHFTCAYAADGECEDITIHSVSILGFDQDLRGLAMPVRGAIHLLADDLEFVPD